jgi:nitroreductase
VDVLEAILNRRSVRRYSNRPIDPAVLARMRQVLRAAPSACNNQPRHFVFVTDPDLRRAVAKVARDQNWIADAPVIVVACGYPAKAYQKMGGFASSLDIDLAIALDHLTLAAVAEGLGTCWIGAFSEPGVRPILAIPDEVKVVAMTPLGYPADAKLIAPLDDLRRKSIAELFSENRYGSAMK